MRIVENTSGAEKGKEIGQTKARRSRVVKTLGFPTAIGAILLGPHLVDMSGESHRGQVREALAGVEGKGPSQELEIVQSNAAQSLFGLKGEAVNLFPAQEVANREGKWETLSFNDYLDSSKIDSEKYRISEDGKTLSMSNENNSTTKHGAIRIIGEDGTFIAVGEDFRVNGDETRRIGNLVLAGGALNGPQSDTNKDGIVTQEELNIMADESARENLQDAFHSPEKIASNDLHQR